MLSQYNPANAILSSQRGAIFVSRSLHKKAKSWFEPRSNGMTVYNHVVQVGDPTLRSRPMEVLPDHFKQDGFKLIINTMKSVMERYDAAGLSAPQIGAPLRIVAVQITEKQLSYWSDDAIVKKRIKHIPLKFFINPTIKIVENEPILDREGCCSVHGYSALVPRARKVIIAGLDENGLDVSWEAEDWSARIVQHEMDHMEGIIFTDKMVPSSLEMNYWKTVNNRNGNFKLGFGGVGKLWLQYFFPKQEA